MVVAAHRHLAPNLVGRVPRQHAGLIEPVMDDAELQFWLDANPYYYYRWFVRQRPPWGECALRYRETVDGYDYLGWDFRATSGIMSIMDWVSVYGIWRPPSGENVRVYVVRGVDPSMVWPTATTARLEPPPPVRDPWQNRDPWQD